MEGRITEDLNINNFELQPYINHYGYGNSIGAGDVFNRGICSINYNINNDFNKNCILSFNGNKTYMVNGYLVYVQHIHQPWIMGKVVKNDFTTQTCYMSKVNNKIVVANSLKEVIEEMREKISKKNNTFDIAEAFVLSHPDYQKEYDWDEMVAWHVLDVNSCLEGRIAFSKIYKKKNNDKATPEELIKCAKETPAKELALEIEKIYLTLK